MTSKSRTDYKLTFGGVFIAGKKYWLKDKLP